MKYKTNGYEVEGTPAEIREFIYAEKKTTKVHTGIAVKNRTHKAWTKSDDTLLMENWETPNGRGDRTKYPHNKRVAKMLGRTYDGVFARFKQLRK